MWSRAFWMETADRAIKSAAQMVLVSWGIGDAIANAFTLDWQLALGVAAGAAVVSVLTSVASAPFGVKGTASVLS